MVSKLQKKGKKGFTLVELIVVIAIIAILAAVAVPTTMHFVDKANASKEGQQMNISSSVDNLIAEGISTSMNIADTSDTAGELNNVIAKKLNEMGENKNIGSIVVKVEKAAAAKGKHVVKYVILGAKYADWKEAQVAGTVSMQLTTAQILDGIKGNIDYETPAVYNELADLYITYNFKAKSTKIGDTTAGSVGLVQEVLVSSAAPTGDKLDNADKIDFATLLK